MTVSEPVPEAPKAGMTLFGVQNQLGLAMRREERLDATPPGIRPPRRFTHKDLGLPEPIADPGAVDREARERLQRDTDRARERQERDAERRAAAPTLEQQVAAAIRRITSLEAGRIEDRVRIVSLEEALAAMKPAPVARIGRTPAPGSAA